MVRHIRSTVVMASAAAFLVAGLAAGVIAQGPGRPGGPGGPGGLGGPGGRGGFGGPMMGGPGRGPGGPLGLPLGQLDLTDAQRDQIRGIAERYQPELRAAAKKERDARDAQRKAIETVPLNEGLIRQAADALGAANADLAVLHARLRNDALQVLTAEQQKKLQDIQARRESMMKQREQNMQKRMQNRREKGKA